MLKPTDRAVRAFYDTLARYDAVGAAHEQAVKTAFHDVLQAAAAPEWVLVPEFTPPGRNIRYDGALRDAFGFTLGYWEAKDSADDLEREVQRKIERGYSLRNTLFQSPARALLYQDDRLVLDADLARPEGLLDALDRFLTYREPEIERFHQAVAEFRARIPDLARGLVEKIETARQSDAGFRRAFEAFVETCRQSINPNLRAGAVEEMLVQHLLTERLVRTVFGNPDFGRKNAIAEEIERVVSALTARHFSRTQFLGQLDRYYRAIEDAAAGITDYAEKQAFLNTVYEQFFQGFSERTADTHGIVYTPQPLVDFMVRSVDRLLETHFGQTLASPGVHVLDPFVGTGNFLVRVVEQIPAPLLPPKYRDELHANEVMLLPYYVASLNVEHAYFEKTGRYEPFEGIVLVDTFEMVEGKTVGMFSAENTARAERQRNSPIKVILGNPPYNAQQVNANDANQNRKYPLVDGRIAETFAAGSSATLLNKLYDPYIRAFRWASDRLGSEGIVAFVTNSSFVLKNTFDGMRTHLERDFSEIYVLNLKGDARTAGEPRRREGGNVFHDQIRVGVAVTLLIRRRDYRDAPATIHYFAAEDYASGADKLELLVQASDLNGVAWRTLQPNTRHDWLTAEMREEWGSFLPLVSQSEKASDDANETTLCDQYSLGVSTNRDVWVYGFDREHVAERVERFVDTYNAQVVKWQRKGSKLAKPEDVVTTNDREIKWSSTLLRHLKAGDFADTDAGVIRPTMYRPFVVQWLYYDHVLVDRPGLWQSYFPTPETENRVVCVSDKGWRTGFGTLMLSQPGDLHLLASADAFQYVPFWVYREDGTRDENVTDWALATFCAHYDDEAITKWDLFHYAYAVLHHPAYRARYAADLRRTLPRVPFAPAFRPFAGAGRALADLHVGFETAPEHPLHAERQPLTYRVEAMRWADAGKTALRLNEALTLEGIPPEAHAYRLGNRSALDWLVDQLRVKTDARSGIVHDPNDASDPERIVRLVRQVTHVSVETARIVAVLPELGLPKV